MKTISKIFILAAVAGLFAACQQDDIVPDTPVGEYVKVRFTTADGNAGKASTRAAWHDPKGSGNLYFDWEEYPKDGPGLVIAIQNKEEFLYSYESDTPAEGEEPIGSSFLTVEPVEEYDETDGADKYSNRANFETVRYYDAEDIKYATRVLAVAPVQHDDENPVVWAPTDFYAEASMPTSFTQTASGDPSFLRDYMIMCGSAEMNNGTASIEFEHIPATFRFIITNKRPSAATIKSVKISRDDEGNIGSTLVRFGARTDTDFFRQLENPCTGITTVISGDDAVLATGGKYTAYAMALPVGEYNEQNAFKDKKIQFTIGAGTPDNEYLSFVLDAEDLAAVNPGKEYDWVGGKSYTIRMSLNDVLTFDGITVGDWTQTDIDGGVAEELIPNSFDATAMTADELNAAVATALAAGYTDIEVTLKPDAPAEMFTAIRRALLDTEGVADGSINLTLKGVTAIPDHNNSAKEGPAIFGDVIQDENGQYLDEKEWVTQLASINLPDVTEIGAQAFYFCENLVTVSAPKAQTIGAQALGYTALTSVEFPELTTIPTDMFGGTWTLSSAKFPKVTTIEQGGLLVGAIFRPENNPTPFPLELTAEGDITFNGSNHFNIASQNYSGKVDLVLNIDKKDQVTFHDDCTATWQVRDDLSYTFKSITFVGE